MELIARKSDLRIGPSTKFGLRLPIRMPSLNFRNGFWQNGHQIWIQRAKTMDIDYLHFFFSIRTPKKGLWAYIYCSGQAGQSLTAAGRCGRPVHEPVGVHRAQQTSQLPRGGL